MKNLIKTLVISSTLLLSAGAALADNNRVADHRTDLKPMARPMPARPFIEQNVLDAERAFGRRGTVTLEPSGFRKAGKDLFVLSSDQDVDIRFVKITYARGRTVMLRGTRGRLLDLPDGGRIRSVEVSYVNRGGARGATIKLIARGGFDQDHDHGRDDNGWGRGGRFSQG